MFGGQLDNVPRGGQVHGGGGAGADPGAGGEDRSDLTHIYTTGLCDDAVAQNSRNATWLFQENDMREQGALEPRARLADTLQTSRRPTFSR